MQNRFVYFEGVKYGLEGNYYRRWNYAGPGECNLHRAVWAKRYGEIPKGFEIHHKDFNPLNNEISNLACLPGVLHQKEHAERNHRRGVLKPPTAECRRAAAKWHGSKEGKIWHREHGKKTWADREWVLCICQECGQEFKSPYPSRAKYCHTNCKQDAIRRRAGRVVGVRPYRRKPRVLCSKRVVSK